MWIKNKDLSIIIVNYNTKELTKQTIDSVLNTAKGLTYEIIVVDNASKDGSDKMMNENYKDNDKVVYIKNEDNLGFSKANNIGIRRAAGRYVLLLNSDTVVVEDCLYKCFKYMEENKDIGVLGCKVVLTDGRLDHACKRGYPSPWNSLTYILKLDKIFKNSKRFGGYDLTYLSEDDINDVDALMGAFMMVKIEAIEKIGLLDEEFFMYGEDIDWAYRIKEAGYRVVYYPVAKIIHYKGASSRKRRFMTIYEFHRAMYLFYKKHYYKNYNILVTGAVYAGIGLKLGLTLFVNLFKKR